MPSVVDVLTMGKLLRMLGITVAQREHTVVDAQIIRVDRAPYDLSSDDTGVGVGVGARWWLSRMGEAKVSLPGGCAIGSRRSIFIWPAWKMGRPSKSAWLHQATAVVFAGKPHFISIPQCDRHREPHDGSNTG